MRWHHYVKLALLLIIIWGLFSVIASGGQTHPDAKRVKQIQAALVEHGYEAGKTWPQTQEILRGIARAHGWQTHRAPDARVLILLDLGNKYSDPEIILEERNHLDPAPKD